MLLRAEFDLIHSGLLDGNSNITRMRGLLANIEVEKFLLAQTFRRMNVHTSKIDQKLT
jgi:hypothetical protein